MPAVTTIDGVPGISLDSTRAILIEDGNVIPPSQEPLAAAVHIRSSTSSS